MKAFMEEYGVIVVAAIVIMIIVVAHHQSETALKAELWKQYRN